MSPTPPRPNRRGFLGITGTTAALAACAAALPTLGALTAGPAGHRFPAATHPHHPTALYPEDCDDDTEPLNAGVRCGADPTEVR
ncbi:hypothetical protein F0L17_02910 [Streptomyces sp. TRM43335]|uniref:Twin-arginine translocation signal domain-containing protein n=1 Tax=Streptomyces taklimakanensis TaxID=2569853 RepID=A0A6G2B758_9ACTN|nr:hypothetical protein [Streptomyces taklimakanensis]MTE18097.1 hypothetical protein [Streptomyces taklimakanensis]